jgi:mitochondrial fission protein ELM1
MTTSLRVWLLLGHRRGDNNQVLALGEALGLPFETRTLSYRSTARPIMRLLPRSIRHLTRASRNRLEPPWPDLVIGIGRRSVPVALWIREQNTGRTRIVRLGNPRASPGLFDLVLTTPQYPVPAADNVVTLPLALTRFRAPVRPTGEETAFFDGFQRPHTLLSLGGNAPMWRLNRERLLAAIEERLRRATRDGGTLLIAPSPRTPAPTLELVRSSIAGSAHAAVLDPGIRYAAALADADEHLVTADSISMISEAILTAKPVGLIEVERTERGRLRLGDDPAAHGLRDPRRFWHHVEQLGLVGTVDAPRKGDVPDPAAIAVAALRSRVPDLFDLSKIHDWRSKT